MIALESNAGGGSAGLPGSVLPVQSRPPPSACLIDPLQRRQIMCVPWLKGKACNFHSQFGEDGLIAAIFERIGTPNKQCFELGAYDGKTHSNVRALLLAGWSGALIERDAERMAEICALYADVPNVACIHAYVMPWTIDEVLSAGGVSPEPDLGVLDIDEQEFWVWAGMQCVRPRVMVVEYGVGRPVDQLPPLRLDAGEPIPAIQGGRNMIYYLGLAKGYQCVALTECNAVFVSGELLNGG